MGEWFRKRTLAEIRDEARKGNPSRRCELNYIAEKVDDIDKRLENLEKGMKCQAREEVKWMVFTLCTSLS